MNSFITIAGVTLIGLMLLVLIRVIKGPTVIDRLVAVNVIGTKSIVLLLFSGILFGQLDMFVDIALGYGLLNFIVSIAASRYYQHRKCLEQKGGNS
ncbi:MAG: pH regulation protein F [Verrucomicrobiales bacterium]|nr:pH regulation protein F [Verrucomicrobiales bacterium]MBE86372.1 pH regulation protein F [Verrucomicrobiales bacterium]